MRNLEAKFKLADLETARRRVEALGFVFSATLIQRDTFFAVREGKLKLREEAAGASLIHYRRDSASGFELSHYSIAQVIEPAATKAILESALGIIADVRKRRTLMLRRNVRFHLDEVEQLGRFGEIEMVLRDCDDAALGRGELGEILDALEIGGRDLIAVSYFELMA